MTHETKTSADLVIGERTTRYDDAVERMLVAILDELPNADLFDALHDVRRQDIGGRPGEIAPSPRYSHIGKRRTRNVKR
ncbi:MAG: hypothetical protein ACK5YI_05275 [Rhodospirillales bacterium]|jgi:hypothetical protein